MILKRFLPLIPWFLLGTALAVMLRMAYDVGYFDARTNAPEPSLDYPDAEPRTHLPHLGGSAPPQEYWGNNSVTVHFIEPTEINRYCSPTAVACYSPWERAIYMPNPCQKQYMIGSRYTLTLCHELGHANGWSHRDGSHRNVCTGWPLRYESKEQCIFYTWTGTRDMELLKNRFNWWWRDVKWETKRARRQS